MCRDDRLWHLMLMAVEPNLVKSFDLDELVDDFGLNFLTELFIAIRTLQ